MCLRTHLQSSHYSYCSNLFRMSAVGMSCPLFSVLVCLAVMGNPAAADCSTLVMLNMAACLPFITVGSTMQNPEENCCLGLKAALETGAECLCQAFINSMHLGVTINATMALTLPSACHFSDFSISNCGLSIGTSAAPAVSPLAMSPTSVEGASGIAPTPALAPHHSSSSSLAAAFKLLLVFIVSNISLTVL